MLRDQHYRGSSHTFSAKSAQISALMKCLYADAHTIGNKQEELEVCMQLQGCSLIRITRMWWVTSHNWSVSCHGCHSYLQEGQKEDPRN